MTLDHLAPGNEARVLDIRAGLGLRRRLNHLGIHVGDVILLVGYGAFRGPLLVQVHGMQVALGRGVARHVLVEPLARSTAASPSPPRLGRRNRRRRRPLR